MFVLIFIISLIIFLGVYYWNDIKSLSSVEGQIAFKEKLESVGILSVLIVIVINVMQVVVAFIPGEFIEIISGMLFGPIGGLMVCLVGFTIGTITIFALVKLLGKPFIDLNISNKSKLNFLENETRALTILFFVFLIPGTPKDFITYAIPFTKINMWHFIIVSNLARIPSIITSTLIGSSIISGHYTNAIIVTIITAAVAIIGIIFNKQITNKIEMIVNKH